MRSRVGIIVTLGAVASVVLGGIAGCGRSGAGNHGEAGFGESGGASADARIGGTAPWAGHTLPDGVVLSQWVNGGIEGLAHELRLTEDGQAEMWIFGERAVSMPLMASEGTELGALVSRGRPMMESESNAPDVADGMGVGLLFAGRGRADADEQVRALAGRVFDLAQTVAEITSQPVVVIGEAREGPRERRWSVAVSRVLKAPREEALVSSGMTLVLDAFGPQHAVPGERIWGLTRDPNQAERAIAWRQTSIELEPRIEAALQRSGAPQEAYP